MKKRIVASVLCLAMSLSLVTVGASAAEDATAAADTLHELGLFSGTGTNPDGSPVYDLERTPTRSEAVTMLVRLLGKEEEAKTGSWETPFTDVDEWAKPYVGYAYANKLTTGTSETTFGGSMTVSPSQYLTFVLRALGYQSGADFQWDKAWELSDQLGITHGEYGADTPFTRGGVALISHASLSAHPKGSDKSLMEELGLGKIEPAPTELPTPTPTSSATVDLELVNKGESTGIDPQRPVESAPPLSEIGLPSGIGVQVGESDDGLAVAGTIEKAGDRDDQAWITESAKYVQVSDKVIGTLETKYNEWEGSDGKDYSRLSYLKFALYVGESITLDLRDFGYDPNEYIWLLDSDSYITATDSGNGKYVLKAKSPVANNYIGRIGLEEDVPSDRILIEVTVYEKKPTSWAANFHVATDYEPVYYTNGAYGTWWVTEKGVKFNGTNNKPTNSEFGMNADFIRIYPDSSLGIPASDMENGYIKDEAVEKYFTFSNSLGGHYNRRITIGPNGGIGMPCVDFTSSACDHKATITVTSKKDGRSCSIDLACLYYQP